MYDLNGNQTDADEKYNGIVTRSIDMTYDLFNRMTSWSDGSATNTYGYRGSEWHRSSLTADGTTTGFLYDVANVIADISAGNVFKSYVTPMLDQNLSITDHATSQTYYCSQDDRQSVHNLTDSAGAIAVVYDYTAIGESVTAITNPAGPSTFGLLTFDAIGNRYQYTGRELNPYSGNYYFRYRTFSPGIGMFSARDPLGYVDGMSIYSGYFSLFLGRDPYGTAWWNNWDDFENQFIMGGGLGRIDDLTVISDYTTDDDEDAWDDTDVDSVETADYGNDAFLDTLAEANNPVGTLNLSGHGVSGHVGITTGIDPTAPGTGGVEQIREDSSDDIMDRIRDAVSKGGTINFCSCGSGSKADKANQVQRFADRLGKGITVCACNGGVTPPCNCKASWICRTARKKAKQ